MSNTLVFECNRATSKNVTASKLEWSNTIDPVRLETGDKVSMVKCILNKRGASTSSVIEFESTMEEELLIGYYTTDHDVGVWNEEKTKWVKLHTDQNFTDGTRSRQVVAGGGGYYAYTEEPYIYCRTSRDSIAGGTKVYPRIQKVQISIPKGSYAVASLADLISQQLSNGVMSEPFDYKVNNALKENLLEYGLPFNNKCMLRSYPSGILPNSGADDSVETFSVAVNFMRKAYDKYIKPNNDLTALPNTAGTLRKTPAEADMCLCHFYNNSGESEDFPTSISIYIGSAPYIQWNTTENRFFLQQLHMPFQVPTIDEGATKANPDAGQDATEFKMQTGTIKPQLYCNPRQAFTGIWILNPAFLTCKSEGDVQYTKTGFTGNMSTAVSQAIDNFDNDAGDEAQMVNAFWEGFFNCDYDECFSTTAKADEAFKNTFWYRMGFQKSQFGTKNRFSYKYMHTDTVDTEMRGITTIQDYSIALAQASSGLGPGHNTLHDVVVRTFCGDGPTRKSGTVDITQNWRVLTETKPLVAQSLPQLSSEIPYYNVYSDICPANWFSNKGGRFNLIGNVSLNYQNADMIYSFADGIEFEITEPMMLTNIRTRIVRPDGRIADEDFFDPYSCVIYKIVRPMKLYNSQNITLEEKGEIVEEVLEQDEKQEVDEIPAVKTMEV